jgi:hypothetical protein
MASSIGFNRFFINNDDLLFNGRFIHCFRLQPEFILRPCAPFSYQNFILEASSSEELELGGMTLGIGSLGCTGSTNSLLFQVFYLPSIP